MNDIITAEQFSAWKKDPCTEAFMDKLYDEREDMKEGLANNLYDNEVEIKGRCQAMALILNMDYTALFPNGEFVPSNLPEDDDGKE